MRSRARLLAGSTFAISALLSASALYYAYLGRAIPLLPLEFGVKGYAN